ncbi:SDR family NAD(P)-dependent oxidoreductase, partial [Klebsiella pneumoniae]|nr:SDR family NAD(P)-dependent oxidoreductase [Klebsiella pneumoniae]
ISRREVIKLSFMTLVNKSAIITGGTRGIGFAIAEKIVANGGSVFICGRSRTRVRDAISLLSASGRADGEVCDIRNEDQVRMMIDEAERRFGGIDI